MSHRFDGLKDRGTYKYTVHSIRISRAIIIPRNNYTSFDASLDFYVKTTKFIKIDFASLPVPMVTLK